MKGHLSKLKKLSKKIPRPKGLVFVSITRPDGSQEWLNGKIPTDEQLKDELNMHIQCVGVEPSAEQKAWAEKNIIINHRPVGGCNGIEKAE